MTCYCRKCREAVSPPEQIGDAHGIVLELHMDIETARYLAYDVLDRRHLRDDGFAKEIFAAVDRLERRIETATA